VFIDCPQPTKVNNSSVELTQNTKCGAVCYNRINASLDEKCTTKAAEQIMYVVALTKQIYA